MAQKGGIIGPFLILGGLGAVGYFGLKYMRAHQAQQAGNMRIKIQGVHLENDGTVNMDLLIMNPNSAAFTFKSVLGNLSVEGKNIAELKMFGEYTVRPNDQATIPVMAKIMPVVFKALQSSFKGRTVPLHFQGVVNVNDNAVPLQLTA